MESTKSSRSKPLGVVVVLALVVLVLVLDMRRRSAEDQLAQLSVQLNQLNGGAGNEEQNKAAAKAIVDKVRRLIEIPADIEPTVATIVDVETLRTRNAFYGKAENGDNLIVTPDRAILYSSKKDMILDVVPVQIQAASSAAAGQTVSTPAARSSAARSSVAAMQPSSAAAASTAASAQ